MEHLVKFCPFILKIWSKKNNKLLNQSCVVTLLQICEKQRLDLVNMMCIQNLVSFCQFVLRMLSKKQILTSIRGPNPVANLQKPMIYVTNVDLVNDNEYTKFGLILSIRSQDIEYNSNSDMNQGPLSCCKIAKKTTIYNTNKNLV